MAKTVKSTVTVTTVNFLVADTANETVRTVSTRFPYKVKLTNKLIKSLTEETQKQGLHFIEIKSIDCDKKKYAMPVEMFVTLGTEVTE